MNVNRILFLLLVAGITFLVVLLLARPDLLENVWMWLVGLAGSIIKVGQQFVKFCQKTFADKHETTIPSSTTSSAAANTSTPLTATSSANTPNSAPSNSFIGRNNHLVIG